MISNETVKNYTYYSIALKAIGNRLESIKDKE